MKCILKGDYRCESSNANPLQQVQECWLRECYKWFDECFFTAATHSNKKNQNVLFIKNIQFFNMMCLVRCFHIWLATQHKTSLNHSLKTAFMNVTNAKIKWKTVVFKHSWCKDMSIFIVFFKKKKNYLAFLKFQQLLWMFGWFGFLNWSRHLLCSVL